MKEEIKSNDCWRCKSCIDIYWQSCQRCGASFSQTETIQREKAAPKP